jgi:hypothetical protein
MCMWMFDIQKVRRNTLGNFATACGMACFGEGAGRRKK